MAAVLAPPDTRAPGDPAAVRDLRTIIIDGCRTYGARVGGVEPERLSDEELWAGVLRDLHRNPGGTADTLAYVVNAEATEAEIAADDAVRIVSAAWDGVLTWEQDPGASPATLAEALQPVVSTLDPAAPPAEACWLVGQTAELGAGDVCAYWIAGDDDVVRGPDGVVHAACQRVVLAEACERVGDLLATLAPHASAPGTAMLSITLRQAVELAANAFERRGPVVLSDVRGMLVGLLDASTAGPRHWA